MFDIRKLKSNIAQITEMLNDQHTLKTQVTVNCFIDVKMFNMFIDSVLCKWPRPTYKNKSAKFRKRPTIDGL